MDSNNSIGFEFATYDGSSADLAVNAGDGASSGSTSGHQHHNNNTNDNNNPNASSSTITSNNNNNNAEGSSTTHKSAPQEEAIDTSLDVQVDSNDTIHRAAHRKRAHEDHDGDEHHAGEDGVDQLAGDGDGMQDNSNNPINTATTAPPPKKRRARQVLSCTFCQRRKQKCDKVVPCANCIKRGKPDECHIQVNTGEVNKQPFASVAEVDYLKAQVAYLDNVVNQLKGMLESTGFTFQEVARPAPPAAAAASSSVTAPTAGGGIIGTGSSLPSGQTTPAIDASGSIHVGDPEHHTTAATTTTGGEGDETTTTNHEDTIDTAAAAVAAATAEAAAAGRGEASNPTVVPEIETTVKPKSAGPGRKAGSGKSKGKERNTVGQDQVATGASGGGGARVDERMAVASLQQLRGGESNQAE